MPFKTPTLPELVGRAGADLAPAALRRSDAEVMARVHAGAAYGLYGYQAWIARQILPDTADEDMILRMAQLRLRRPRLAAVIASGPVLCAGADGALVPEGAVLQHTDGRQYRVTVGAVIAGETAVTVEAVEVGQLGNLDGGEPLGFVSPPPGVADACIVAPQGITGGVDQESLESVRQRVIRSYRVIPHGGSADDYVTWALEVPGVTRAWTVRNWVGPGTVAVFIVRDGDADPIPGAPDLAVAYDYIEAQRPTTAELYVLPPVPRPVSFQMVITPDTPAVRAAVTAGLRDLLAIVPLPGGAVPVSHVNAAISNSAGEHDHQLIEPAAALVFADNELPMFGGVEFL